MRDWKDSRHPAAIWYNELGMRIQELKEMQEGMVEETRTVTHDSLACFLGCSSWEREIERMRTEMASIELHFVRETWWEDHWELEL